MDNLMQQTGDAQRQSAMPTCGERVAFSVSLGAAVCVLGVGCMSLGSLFLSALDDLGFMLLSLYWPLRVLVVVGGFLALSAGLFCAIPQTLVTREHIRHALSVLALCTLISCVCILATFVVVARG